MSLCLVPDVLTSVSPPGKIVTSKQDGPFCYQEICGPNGTVEKHFGICEHTSPPLSSSTPTTTTSVSPITPSTTMSTTLTASTGKVFP